MLQILTDCPVSGNELLSLAFKVWTPNPKAECVSSGCDLDSLIAGMPETDRFSTIALLVLHTV